MVSTIAAGGVSCSSSAATPRSLERRDVLVGHDAAADEQDVAGAGFLEEGDDARKDRHVRARQEADAEHVDVLVDRRAHHLLGSLVQPRVDHVHAGVAQTAGDDLHAAVVSVEAHLGDEHANGLLPGHGVGAPS